MRETDDGCGGANFAQNGHTTHTLHRQRSAPAVVQSKVKEVRIKGYVKYGWRPAVPSLYLFGMKERAKG